MKLTLEIMSKTRLVVVRLPPSLPIPPWILDAMSDTNFISITKTTDELSLVCPENIVPTTTPTTGMKMESGWTAFQVRGPLDFAWTGILAGLAQPLAAQNVSIFAISTYDTDYILVKEEMAQKTAAVLRELGHNVVQEGDEVAAEDTGVEKEK